MPKVFRYNLGASAAFAALAVYVMLAASRLQPGGMAKFGPGYWPYILGTAMLLLSLGLAAETIVGKLMEKRRAARQGTVPAPNRPPFDFRSPGLFCVYRLCALLLAFVLLLRHVNFIAATLFFAPACMWLLGVRKKTVLASVSLGLPLAVYAVFTWLLKITLP